MSIRRWLTFLLVSSVLPIAFPVTRQDAPQRGFLQSNPSAEHPFGRPNPEVPPELVELEFMIGEFEAVDHLLQPDGSWLESRGVWTANYFLNGFGIQNQYENQQCATSNIRIFDPQRDQRLVTFFKMPGYGCRWVAETVVDREARATWKSECHRLR